MKIHVLGAGSIGSLIATSLSYAPKLVKQGINGTGVEIALILSSKNRLRQFNQHGSILSVSRQIGSRVNIDRKFDAVTADQLSATAKDGNAGNNVLENLIVTTNAVQTESAIQSVLHAITPQTNILLVQNGMGTYDRLVSKFWPNAETRPNIMLGVISHGVRPSHVPFAYDHVGQGSLKLAAVPKNVDVGQMSARAFSTSSSSYNRIFSPQPVDSSEQTESEADVRADNASFTVSKTYEKTDSEASVRADNSSFTISQSSEKTESEASVRADYEPFDLPRKPQPTDSEESVRADQHRGQSPISPKPNPTESEADVRSDYSTLDIEFEKTKATPQPTESEADVRADYEDFPVEKAQEEGRHYPHVGSGSRVQVDRPAAAPAGIDKAAPSLSGGSSLSSYSTRPSSPDNAPSKIPDLFTALLSTGSLLDASVVSYEELRLVQREKLVINACINPLTAIFKCHNGELLQLPKFKSMAYSVAKECFAAFKADSIGKPEYTSLCTRLHPRRMIRLVEEVCQKTAKNKSSMLIAIERMDEPEISFINGYIVNLAKKYNFDTPVNKMLCQMVQCELELSRAKHAKYVPLKEDL